MCTASLKREAFKLKKLQIFFRISLTPISFNNKKKLLSYRKLGMWHPFPYTDFLKLTAPLRCIPIKVEFQVFAQTKQAGYTIYFGVILSIFRKHTIARKKLRECGEDKLKIQVATLLMPLSVIFYFSRLSFVNEIENVHYVWMIYFIYWYLLTI